MKLFVRLGLLGPLGLIASCSSEPLLDSNVEVAEMQQALQAAEHVHVTGCGDHEDDARLDTAKVRENAAQPLRWSSKAKRPKKNGTTQVKVLGFNDFHGQLVEGRRVANRPVGGRARELFESRADRLRSQESRHSRG